MALMMRIGLCLATILAPIGTLAGERRTTGVLVVAVVDPIGAPIPGAKDGASPLIHVLDRQR